MRLPVSVGAAVAAMATYFCRRYRTPNRVIATPCALRKTGLSAMVRYHRGAFESSHPATVPFAARWGRDGPYCLCRRDEPDTATLPGRREHANQGFPGPGHRY